MSKFECIIDNILFPEWTVGIHEYGLTEGLTDEDVSEYESFIEDRLLWLWDEDPAKRDQAIDFLVQAAISAQSAHNLVLSADEWLKSKKETEE